MWGQLDNSKPTSDEDDLYKLVGCNENSTEEQISTEYKLLALKLHPDKNPGDDSALLRFQKLQEAVSILLDPSKRQNYDKWRHSEVSIPYKQWVSMNSRFQTTMHWAKPREQVMLENGLGKSSGGQTGETLEKEINSGIDLSQGHPTNVAQQKNKSGWKSEDSDVYKGFRNYDI